MTRCAFLGWVSVLTLSTVLTGAAMAQEAFTLTSPAMGDGETLPADLRCTRYGGDGLSPPLEWSNPPEGTASFALIMYHYPLGGREGVDAPSQYWLLWNIPVGAVSLPRGNPDAIGNEGANKDAKSTGYTSPCSPKQWFSFTREPQHQYFIELFALNAPLEMLPAHDDLSVDWKTMTTAMAGKVLTSTRISFLN